MNFSLFKHDFYRVLRNSSNELSNVDIRIIYNTYINHIQRDIIRREEQNREEKKRKK